MFVFDEEFLFFTSLCDTNQNRPLNNFGNDWCSAQSNMNLLYYVAKPIYKESYVL